MYQCGQSDSSPQQKQHLLLTTGPSLQLPSDAVCIVLGTKLSALGVEAHALPLSYALESDKMRHLTFSPHTAFLA